MNFDIGVVAQHFPRNFDPLGQIENGVLGLTVGDANDQTVKQARTAAHQILVPPSQRIKRSGINRNLHRN